jgi:chromate transporter
MLPKSEAPSFSAAFLVWLKIGILSFGGPAGQIALMHTELVERRRWVDEARFLHALNYCMLLPGPEATQLATYIGWLLHKTRGGITAGVLFVLPGFFYMLLVSAFYSQYHTVPAVAAGFFGLKAAVVAIVLEALQRIGRRALKNRFQLGIAWLAFVGLFLFAVPFPLIVLGAGALGVALRKRLPAPVAPADPAANTTDLSVVERMSRSGELAHTQPRAARSVLILGVSAALWFAPLLALAAAFGRESVWLALALFFSKAAVVTFGGAYAVLAYVADQAVTTYGWLRPGEMLDGLGLAETTPGPLILVLEFVGYVGAFRAPGGLTPFVSGLLGATITVWVTFVPCFLWIFLGAPYLEALRASRTLHAALSAVTAAVVGVIAKLSLWFALHVLFESVSEKHFGPLRLLVPNPVSLNAPATVLCAFAFMALFRFRWGTAVTLVSSTLLGLGLRLLA